MIPEVKTNNVPLMEVRNIDKSFPGVKALDDVSVKFYPGEVNAVVGENGAGKSTLMKVMVGAYKQDEGTILFQGQAVSFNHPIDAQKMGISIIYQEFNLLPERTVAQNIFLGREPSRFGVVNVRQLNKQAMEILAVKEIRPVFMGSGVAVSQVPAPHAPTTRGEFIQVHFRPNAEEASEALEELEEEVLETLESSDDHPS